jgi:hypothetical protein
MHQDGPTGIMNACIGGHLPVVRYLVGKGADINLWGSLKFVGCQMKLGGDYSMFFDDEYYTWGIVFNVQVR